MLGRWLRMEDNQEFKLCRYCGKELPKRLKMFCDKDCQVNFKREKKKAPEQNKSIQGMGRTSPRNYEIKIRLSKYEVGKIKAKAEEIHLPVSQFARVVVLNSSINPRIPELIFL